MVTNGLIPVAMRRNLVLTDESARHPFLASLPPHVRTVDDLAVAEEAEDDWLFTSKDAREFVMAYSACFVAAMTFIV